jgi:hypothetical protein
MENKDNKLDNLINNLRRQKPEMDNAELLTENIMNEINRKMQRTKSIPMIWIRVVSTSAAVLLLGLFLFQQAETEEKTSTSRHNCLVEQHINFDSLCIQNSSNKREMYFCYMRRNLNKNRQLDLFTKQPNN